MGYVEFMMGSRMIRKGAIVTGAAKRIGREIVLALANDGYDIALHYNSSERDAAALRDDVVRSGVRCELFRLNLAKAEEIPEFMGMIRDFNPECSVLINNASIFRRARLMETDIDFFDQHIDINLKAPFFLTQQFAKHFSSGIIINILDTKIARTVIEYFVYTLTKKALGEFTRMAAKELAPGYRVNGIGPGLILPPAGESDDYLKKLSVNVPLQNRGYPEDIVAAVKFLINHHYITGECLFIDGGEHLR